MQVPFSALSSAPFPYIRLNARRSKMPRKQTPKSVEEIDKIYEGKTKTVLQDLHHTVHESTEKKEDLEMTLGALEELHDVIRSDRKLSNYHQSKLKSQYTTALKQAEAEAEVLRECLQHIKKVRRLRTEQRITTRQFVAENQGTSDAVKVEPIRRGKLMVLLQQAANTMPLWIGKLGENPPPLCGGIAEAANHLCEPGSSVAALVKGSENEHNWILAEVIAYNSSTHKYDVEDVDEEQKEQYTVVRNKVIPLPHYRANPQSDADAIFPVDAFVLALYPQTTCFYKGVVEQVPICPTDDYLVAFEDASYPNGFSPPLRVPQRYVLANRNVR